jgi:hypothetical protein
VGALVVAGCDSESQAAINIKIHAAHNGNVRRGMFIQ